MAGSSLIHYASRQKAHGQRLHWGRVGQDGLPFLGNRFPMVPDEEYEERVVRVAKPQNGFFNARNAKQNKIFLDVLECIANGWYRLIYIKRFWRGTTKHYIEWCEYYMADGSRVPFQSGNIMEMNSAKY